ncbi:MAG TPA: carboxypeptidase-like regulatory domain-containing protein [Candidatus Baltobacteraceae bacterium]|nr:carboxypeptidase-like regulatory domain-containing protein [Candidatus Baltobacteraceae bacterium]
MKPMIRRGFLPAHFGTALLTFALFSATPILSAQSSTSNSSSTPDPSTSSDKPAENQTTDAGMTRLKIRVTDANDKPVGNASVYVRYYTSGGFLRHDKLEELNFKTNQDGSVKVPEIPQGKILIQVIAKGWHTYGKWYEISQSEQSVPIKLDPPPHWY